MRTRPTRRRRRISTTRCGPAPRRCGHTTAWCTRAGGAPSWNTATGSSATCASTCSTRSGGCSTWACRRASARPAASWSTRRARRTSRDTQAATFDFPSLRVVWTHRTYGDPPDPKYPWGMTFYGDKGTLKASVMSYDFIPHGDGTPVHEDVVYELEQFPEDKTEKDLERHVAPAIRAHMNDSAAARSPRAARRSPTSSRGTCRRRRASWRTSRWSLAASAAVGSCARRRRPETTRPTGCCAGRTARRGSTRARHEHRHPDQRIPAERLRRRGRARRVPHARARRARRGAAPRPGPVLRQAAASASPNLVGHGHRAAGGAAGAGSAAREAVRHAAAGPRDERHAGRRGRRALPHVVLASCGLPREGAAGHPARADDALARAAPAVEGQNSSGRRITRPPGSSAPPTRTRTASLPCRRRCGTTCRRSTASRRSGSG